jgi:circadian clock protein KaiC
MSHSNQVREFLMTDRGIELVDVYLGPAGVLTGSARASQEGREQEEASLLALQQERKRRDRQQKRRDLDEQIRALRAEFQREEAEERSIQIQEESLARRTSLGRASMAQLRRADTNEANNPVGELRKSPRRK